MLSLFEPQSKVQKDRKIMRETDMRMAKYSRRGLIISFLAVTVSLLFGDFYQQAPRLGILLGVGLLIMTLLRGYYLFRFESLYPRAPRRWRSHYFLVSYLGASWWSLILVTHTWVLEFSSELPLLWFYTIVFCSSVSNVMAPYKRFLTSYLAIVLLPAAFTALLLGNFQGYLYGVGTAFLCLILAHQGAVTSNTYWDRLDAVYELKQKAVDLEAEKLNTEAASDFKNEFLVNMGHELRTVLNDIVGSLNLLSETKLDKNQRKLTETAEKASERQLDFVNSIVDFARIASKELILDINVFNLRHRLEATIEALATQAQEQGVDLNYYFNPDVPQRCKGDAPRLMQIVSTLLHNAIDFSNQGSIFVDIQFLFNTEREGELHLQISDKGGGFDNVDEGSIFDAFNRIETTKAGSGLSLAISRGLAACMGGNIGFSSDPGHGSIIWLKVALSLSGTQPQAMEPYSKLHGKRVLVYDYPDHIVTFLTDELEHWGMIVEQVKSREQALQRIDNALDSDHPFDVVIYYPDLKQNAVPDLSQQLAQDDAYSLIKQVLLVSHEQAMSESFSEFSSDHSSVQALARPISAEVLHNAFTQLLFDITSLVEKSSDQGPVSHPKGDQHILVVDDHRVNQMLAKGMIDKLGYQAQIASNGREALEILEDKTFDLILMDCQMPEMDGFAATREIRIRELDDDRHTPIIAMTAHAAEGDAAKCIASGMDDYMAKPVRYEELEARLRRWLGEVGESSNLPS